MKLKKMLIPALLILILISLSVSGKTAFAADTKNTAPPEDDYFPEFKEADDMKALKTERELHAVSFGGWIETAVIDDRSGSSSGNYEVASSVTISKVWMKTALKDNSFLYIRARDVLNLYIKKPSQSDLKTNNDIDLDAGFISAKTGDNTVKYELGRKYYTLGTGLVFNGRGDGEEIIFYTKYVDIKLFGLYTGLLSKLDNPYRLNSLDVQFTDKGKRFFFGVSLSKDINNQTAYIIGLYQKDNNDDVDSASYPNAGYKYNSGYIGLGIKGILGNAFYYGEAVLEQGKSYTDYTKMSLPTDENSRRDINAFAATAGINYFFNVKTNPALSFNYAYGSGDKHRTNTSSPTGNGAGNDNGFIYFGTFSGGYALRPYLSNIHVIQAGFTFSPFSGFENTVINRLNLTAKYSNYQKDKTSAPINLDEAAKNKRDIGHGADLALRWKIFSDFSFYTNFGLFFPGGAYSSEEKVRTFAMTGVYLSF